MSDSGISGSEVDSDAEPACKQPRSARGRGRATANAGSETSDTPRNTPKGWAAQRSLRDFDSPCMLFNTQSCTRSRFITDFLFKTAKVYTVIRWGIFSEYVLGA